MLKLPYFMCNVCGGECYAVSVTLISGAPKNVTVKAECHGEHLHQVWDRDMLEMADEVLLFADRSEADAS
jgi:hypothetical protein